MRKLGLVLTSALMAAGLLGSGNAFAQTQKFSFAWSTYIGWEPLSCMNSMGIAKKWAQKYGIAIEIVRVNEYMESVNAYTAGAFDGVAVTNMDVLVSPAKGGKDSTALVIGDFSNGNDGIVAKKAKTMKELSGKAIHGVELSVSHYLVARALEMNGMSERDVSVVNTGDSDISSLFLSRPEIENVVTWNPMLMDVRGHRGATMLFDSSQIPGEIIDMLVVRSNAPDSFKKALTGAWYETMGMLSGRAGRTAQSEMLECMRASSGPNVTLQEVRAQLGTTAMFYNPGDASAFAKSPEIKKTMEQVRAFSFDHGLFDNAPSKDVVGIQFPDGTTMGDPRNVKLRFDATFMDQVAKGSL